MQVYGVELYWKYLLIKPHKVEGFWEYILEKIQWSKILYIKDRAKSNLASIFWPEGVYISNA
jgi:hypothetical protein